ncbi:hypothetical protein QRO11_21515 [Paracidovorax citrulli]|uniref:hypothetical protein n=1 Tax=Paracidovorax citrulli TaxID=80869 RepID=UPI0003188BD6|nr:hypothetical protein [Paracidovorax citrulli]QCX10995.1 hypothetical protein APS58_2159 [Paracidovorax citrulli]UEG46034.1 hypothetical protein LKW27_20690 [Paracidovorax citrulli]UMT86671.1 hypothetical protein FRC90_00580 [Paracidovorax citrulli]UMT94713.1 hypothetical protein FRC97_06765 [Paracidovorax citrulli]WIY34490.1 hypothetical protein QRO11_21515 [Paracidovorax citrulli]
MKHARNLLALAVAGLLATSGMAMTKEEHKAANDRISADYKAAKAKCDGMTGNAKDVCQKEAKGNEKIAKAELEAQYKPSDKNTYKVAEARADAAYDVAKEKCDDLQGDAKSVCQKDAKAAHVKAKEDAKVARAQAKPADTMTEKNAKVAETKKDAAEEKREADYKAAKERCDTMNGDAKDKCVADAKRMYNQ